MILKVTLLRSPRIKRVAFNRRSEDEELETNPKATVEPKTSHSCFFVLK